MLKSLTLKEFTMFQDVTFLFGRHLNVVVGENSSGKTHLLKAAYAAIAANASRKHNLGEGIDKSQMQLSLADKLSGVFRPDGLWRLVRRGRGRKNAYLSYSFDPPELNVDFSFSTVAKNQVKISKLPTQRLSKLPIFLPTREMLTIYPGFVSLYENYAIPFEETWRDTCILLGAPLARGPRERTIKELLVPIEQAMGGNVELDKAGRFYLKLPSGKMEMHLVAEGFRKLAMIARLIATGSLLDKGYLFWDEPEANLNPKIIRAIAKSIMKIADSGVQVFVATHSLFMLRELHVLQRREFQNMETRCFGLHVQGSVGVTVQQGPSMDDVGRIVALEEDLQQSERYMDTEMGVPLNAVHNTDEE